MRERTPWRGEKLHGAAADITAAKNGKKTTFVFAATLFSMQLATRKKQLPKFVDCADPCY